MDEEGEQVAEETHFWKFMWPGFHEKLVLPEEFCRKLKGEMSKHAILKSECGRKRVDVCENDEGEICFKEGWEDFARRNGLIVGNILVFKHTGGFHFNVTVFDETGCEQELQQQENLDNNRRRATKKPPMDSISSYESPYPHFTITMMPHNNGHKRWAAVNIPAMFWSSNGLREKKSATLRDPRGETWAMKLAHTETKPIRCRMTKGWSGFYRSNELEDGDVCVFEVHPHSPSSTEVEMDVKIFRGGLPS